MWLERVQNVHVLIQSSLFKVPSSPKAQSALKQVNLNWSQHLGKKYRSLSHSCIQPEPKYTEAYTVRADSPDL